MCGAYGFGIHQLIGISEKAGCSVDESPKSQVEPRRITSERECVGTSWRSLLRKSSSTSKGMTMKAKSDSKS